MNNFKQFVIFAGLAASLFSCTLQSMEKETTKEEFYREEEGADNLAEILALLLVEPEVMPEKPSFLEKNDELSSRSAKINKQIETKKVEEKIKTKLEGKKINVSPKVEQQREIIATKRHEIKRKNKNKAKLSRQERI